MWLPVLARRPRRFHVVSHARQPAVFDDIAEWLDCIGRPRRNPVRHMTYARECAHVAGASRSFVAVNSAPMSDETRSACRLSSALGGVADARRGTHREPGHRSTRSGVPCPRSGRRKRMRIKPMTTKSEVADSRRPRGLADLVGNISYEVMPFKSVERAVLADVPTSIPLTVTVTEAKGIDTTLDFTERLMRHGYTVTPHLAARQFVDDNHVREVIDRLQTAGVNSVFIVRSEERREGEERGARGFSADQSRGSGN